MYDDAEYLRAQAKLCLDMSRQLSGLADKAHFEKQAMEYTLRAERLKAGSTVLDDDDR